VSAGRPRGRGGDTTPYSASHIPLVVASGGPPEPSQKAASALSGPEPIDIHCPVGPIGHARLSG
jgi:hypothetical protein